MVKSLKELAEPSWNKPFRVLSFNGTSFCLKEAYNARIITPEAHSVLCIKFRSGSVTCGSDHPLFYHVTRSTLKWKESQPESLEGLHRVPASNMKPGVSMYGCSPNNPPAHILQNGNKSFSELQFQKLKTMSSSEPLYTLSVDSVSNFLSSSNILLSI